MPDTDTYGQHVMCACGKDASVEMTMQGGREWVVALPEGWMVADNYPPDDGGLVFACSFKCADASDRSF